MKKIELPEHMDLGENIVFKRHYTMCYQKGDIAMVELGELEQVVTLKQAAQIAKAYAHSVVNFNHAHATDADEWEKIFAGWGEP